MKKNHFLCLIFLFITRGFCILQLINYSYDHFLDEFLILLIIILLERVANILYSQYYIYQAYRNIQINIVQFISSLVFLDYTNMGMLRKEDLHFSHYIFIRNMNFTVYFLSVLPLILNFTCIHYTTGEQMFFVYPLTIFFLLFTMAFVSTVYIYENEQNVSKKKYIITFLIQYLRSYCIWNLTSQLFYRVSLYLLIYCISVLLSTFLFFGITKEANIPNQLMNAQIGNNNNFNNLNMSKYKDKARFIKVLITQALMMVLIENIWAFSEKTSKKPSIRKIAQSVGIYAFFYISFIVKMCLFHYENVLDYPIYLYGVLCHIEIYYCIKNILFYYKNGPYQDAIQLKYEGSISELDLETSLIKKYQNRMLLTKFNLNIQLENSSAIDELNLNLFEFTKQISHILFKISQNSCRISINISNTEELILYRKDNELIFGIKRNANDFTIKFLLSLYNNIQLYDLYTKSKILNIYFTNKDQLKRTILKLEKVLIQDYNACIQPKIILNFKEIEIFNKMNSAYQQQYLMTCLFYKQIQNLLPINPNAVLFDLYEQNPF
ncbi:hypothetical protein ABPG74_021439 [Tetrahymena malaccensis]